MNGFTGHILEAIFINFIRLPLYGLRTLGLSIPISLGLITFELVILPLAIYYDLTSGKWRRLGIPDMAEDFISMKKIGSFRFKTTQIPAQLFPIPPIAKWQKKHIKLLLNKDLHKASKEMEECLESLDVLETINTPLVLHFLESSARSLNLTIIWLKNYSEGLACEDLKKEFIKRRSWLIIWQLLGLQGALILDILSYPLRKAGIPLLVNDIPKIPVPACPE